MRKLAIFLAILGVVMACQPAFDRDAAEKEIYDTEKAFEKMAADSGIAAAFAYYAADSAVILRGPSLIQGKEAIRAFYTDSQYQQAKVNWTPDFMDVSDCGTLGYTYGHYEWHIPDSAGNWETHKGVFHTVWKKQTDKNWRYVWD
jgi:ketosteroid isomerase-like protein